MRFTKLSYCQYLLSSQINYTITNLAEHLESISHDAINYYLKREKLTPRLLWDNVKELVEPDDNGYIIFDDSVLDKRYSEEIELGCSPKFGQLLDDILILVWNTMSKNTRICSSNISRRKRKLLVFKWSPNLKIRRKLHLIKPFLHKLYVKCFLKVDPIGW